MKQTFTVSFRICLFFTTNVEKLFSVPDLSLDDINIEWNFVD